MPASKAMAPEEKRVVQNLASGLLHSRFGGNQTAFAKALGVSQATVSELVSGKKAGGKTLIRMLAMLFPDWSAGSLRVPAETVIGIDTLAMANRAAELLEENKRATRDGAWAVMRSLVALNQPSVHAFYTEGDRLVNGDPQVLAPTEERHLAFQPGPSKRQRKAG